MRLLYKSGPMESLRKWFYKPKREDRSLLAQFFFADEALNMIAAELDSFDGRKEPERCSALVNQLRQAQDRVLAITGEIMEQVLGGERAARGFRVKFPEDVVQDNLAGQLWFGAECLAAGSSILNREHESAAMRPLARALTRSLETVRYLLRERCLRPRHAPAHAHAAQDEMLHESLKIFDRLFAEFELCYVSAMVNVKTAQEFEAQQLVCVLFAESLRGALARGLLSQEQVDSCDPALMFAVPRLAILAGLLDYAHPPLGLLRAPEHMSDMFRPFRSLLAKIRALLLTLSAAERAALERLLATSGELTSPAASASAPADAAPDAAPPAPAPDARALPDRALVSSLTEQVSSLADRLSAIAAEEGGAEGERPASAASAASAARGFLIPNAIGREPAVMSSLSRDHSGVFAGAGADAAGCPVIVPDEPAAGADLTLSAASASLSSLLAGDDDARARFTLGEPAEGGDSGLGTDTASLERSPDAPAAAAASAATAAEARRVLRDWGLPEPGPEQLASLEDALAELRAHAPASVRRRKQRRRKPRAAAPGAAAPAAAAPADRLTLDLDRLVERADDDDERAAAERARADFASSSELVHRLFVCIAGVADQLQTNFAADLRHMLRAVFTHNQSPDAPHEHRATEDPHDGWTCDGVYAAEEAYAEQAAGAAAGAVQAAPAWVPDVAAPACMRCGAVFSAWRRRHHCRACGRVCCAACSSRATPLPRYGEPRAVRVCDPCHAEHAPAAPSAPSAPSTP